MVEVKFCGLTRAEDAAQVGALGGAYAGVIFAGGPRRLDPERAASVLSAAGPSVRRVGVFGAQTPAEIAEISDMLVLDVVQLHGDPEPELVSLVREGTGVDVWAVVRVGPDGVPPLLPELDEVADAIVLDALAPGGLGGSGTTFDWSAVVEERRPRRARLVAAGGLTPENVGRAVAALHPQVVDVSSGVEQAPGIKDHERMRAFADAVRRLPVDR